MANERAGLLALSIGLLLKRQRLVLRGRVVQAQCVEVAPYVRLIILSFGGMTMLWSVGWWGHVSIMAGQVLCRTSCLTGIGIR